MSQWITVALLALTFLTGGCEVNRESVREQEISRTQTVIQTYSEKVAGADERQTNFVEAWESANEIKDLKVFREAMTANVIPKLRQYLTWLESMLPSEENSEGLKIIHNRLVEGYRTIIAAFDTFVADLNEDNIEDRYRVLMEAMGELARIEESYGAQLKNFYAKNRVRMMEDTFHLISKPAVAVEGQEAPVAAEGEPPVPAEAPPTEVPPAEVPPAEVPPAQAPPAEPTGGGH